MDELYAIFQVALCDWHAAASEMSEESLQLWDYFRIGLFDDNNGVAFIMYQTIVNVLPYALSVAGAILVVKLGWRLFRNFTRG